MAQTQATARPINMQSVKVIMNQRLLVPDSKIGKRIRFMIQGNGVKIDVKTRDGAFVLSTIPGQEGVVLTKMIFNVKANSETGMKNPRNIETLKAAINAEKDGKTEEASALFNDYLNRAQISFGVLLPSTMVDKLANGVEIAATVQLVETENGRLITLDPSTIAIVEPEVVGKTTFSFEDLLAGDAGFETDEGKEAEEVTTARMTLELLAKIPVAQLTTQQKKDKAAALKVIATADAAA